MIYELINDFQIDLFECPKRLGNLSFSIDFDEYLSLARSGVWYRKKLEVDWFIPRHPVFQLSEHFAQDWSFGFAKNAVPKMATIFKGVLGVVHLGYAIRQVIGMVKVGWGEMTVRRFEGQRDEGQPEVCNVQDFCRG
jgi:hypothetical protein